MQKGIRFAVFAAEKQTAEQVCKLLHAWSEEICVQIAIDTGDAAVLPDVEQAARYMLLFVDSSVRTFRYQPRDTFNENWIPQ